MSKKDERLAALDYMLTDTVDGHLWAGYLSALINGTIVTVDGESMTREEWLRCVDAVVQSEDTA
jgi:hypothetical protein